MKVFLFVLLPLLVNTMVYDPTQFYLGDNLIVNSLFDTPLVPSFIFVSSMIGWTDMHPSMRDKKHDIIMRVSWSSMC